MGTLNCDVLDHEMNGAEVILQGNSGGVTSFKINYLTSNGASGTVISVEDKSIRLFWSTSKGVYMLVD